MRKFFDWIGRVLVGTYRNIFKKNNEIAEQRLKICNECEYRIRITRNESICSVCGCVIGSKIRVDSESCHKGKW